MGCWDIWCFVCGNPSHGMFTDWDNYVQEIIDKHESSTRTNKYLKITQKIYEAYKKNNKLTSDMKKFSKTTNWMDKCTMLVADNSVVHNVKEDACNITFVDNKNIAYDHTSINTLDHFVYDKIGLFIHTDCYKYVNNKYKIKLKYSDIPVIYKSDVWSRINPTLKYGDIEKYWDQDFDFVNLYIDKKTYLCSSPLKEDKNITQINKNIRKMKLNNDKSRKGPSVSATFYSIGDIRIGNNKKFWIKKSGKWMEIKDTVVSTTFTLNESDMDKHWKYINSLSVIGQYSKKPIFVKSMKKTGKKTTFNIITTDEHKKRLDNL
jgi:hypothetical protein